MEKTNKRHLIALGTYGSHILSFVGKELDFESYILVNEDKPDIEGLSFEFIHFPEKKLFSSITARRKMPQRLKDLLVDLKGQIIILAALGFGSGHGLYEKLGEFIRTLSDQGKFKFVSIRPPEIEGRYPVEIANTVALQLTDLNQRSVSLEDLKIGYGYYSLEDYYQKGDEWIVRRLSEN